MDLSFTYLQTALTFIKCTYPTATEWPSYIPRHWVSFLLPPMSSRDTVEVFELASTRGLPTDWLTDWLTAKLLLALLVANPTGLMTIFYTALRLLEPSTLSWLPTTVFRFSRYGFYTDSTEDTTSHNSSVVACITVATLTWHLLWRNLVTDVCSG
jgi:hypothetical protein